MSKNSRAYERYCSEEPVRSFSTYKVALKTYQEKLRSNNKPDYGFYSVGVFAIVCLTIIGFAVGSNLYKYAPFMLWLCGGIGFATGLAFFLAVMLSEGTFLRSRSARTNLLKDFKKNKLIIQDPEAVKQLMKKLSDHERASLGSRYKDSDGELELSYRQLKQDYELLMKEVKPWLEDSHLSYLYNPHLKQIVNKSVKLFKDEQMFTVLSILDRALISKIYNEYILNIIAHDKQLEMYSSSKDSRSSLVKQLKLINSTLEDLLRKIYSHTEDEVKKQTIFLEDKLSNASENIHFRSARGISMEVSER